MILCPWGTGRRVRGECRGMADTPLHAVFSELWGGSVPKTAVELEELRAEKFAEIERYFVGKSSDPSQAAIHAVEMWEQAEKQSAEGTQPRTSFEVLLEDYCNIVREIVVLLDSVISSSPNEDAG